MQYICPLVVVNDIQVSRKFYESILEQEVLFDHGPNIAFKSGLSIHLKSHFSELVSIDSNDIHQKAGNFELYFEEDDLDSFLDRLSNVDGVRFVHEMKEMPWGQRVVRFYDPDMHIIEVGEPMEVVAKRFLSAGLSAEETAYRISMPKEFVELCL